MDKLFKTILANPGKILFIIFLMTLPGIYFSSQIGLDSSTEIFLVEDDPEKKRYDEFVGEFGGDEILFVMVLTPLEKALHAPWFQQIAEKLESFPWVTGFYNPIEKYRDVLSRDNENWDAANLKEKVALNPFEKKGSFISFEKGSITYAMEVDPSIPLQRKDIFRETQRVFSDNVLNPVTVKIAGQPVLNYYLGETPKEVGRIFFPLLCVISLLALYYLFRDIRLVLVPMLLILVVEITMFGIIGLMGGTLNVITAIVPAILFIITLASAIHLLEHMVVICQGEVSAMDGLLRTMNEKFPPCLFASLTTAVGFGSLALSPIGPIKSLGIYLFIGCLTSLVLLYTLFPCLLTVLVKGGTIAPAFGMTAFFKTLVRITHKWRMVVMVACILTAGYSLVQLPGITFQTNGLQYFKEDSFIRENTSFLEKRGLGLTSMELVLDGEPHSFQRIQILKKLDVLTAELEKINGVQNITSVVSLIKETNGINYDFFDLPSGLAIDSFYKGIRKKNKELLGSFANRDFSKARVSIGLKTIGYDEYQKIRTRVEKIFAESPMARDVNMGITGQFPLILNVQKYLMETLIKSFAFSFAAIGICFFFFLRKLDLWLLSVVPNIFPVFCLFGVMFFAEIDFDVGNIMIASVILGMAVDSTAHFLYQFKTLSRETADLKKSILTAYEKTGGAIIFSAVILASGFLVFSFSDFIPTRNFGILSSFAIIFALIGDLIVLPALMFIFSKRITL